MKCSVPMYIDKWKCTIIPAKETTDASNRYLEKETYLKVKGQGFFIHKRISFHILKKTQPTSEGMSEDKYSHCK